jgi:hypothetical protein
LGGRQVSSKRYHATAVEKNRYLRQCITYMDMNMVRAGVVEHPTQWEFCGYNEIQNPRKRKGIIDFDRRWACWASEAMMILKNPTTNGWKVQSELPIEIKKTSGHKALLSAAKRLLRR